MDYLEFLDRLHIALRPRAYLEIGVAFGASLRLARTHAIAVDPEPRLGPEAFAGKPWLKLYREASDAFFRGHSAAATLEGLPLDLVFIDGFHAFAQVVRDLEHVERWGHAGTVAVIHDVLPANPWQASRAFHDGMWTGDVWRIVPFLEEHRPDLSCRLVAVADTGALAVTGFDPAHAGLAAWAEALDRGYPADGPEYERRVEDWLRGAAPLPPGPVLQELAPRPRPIGHAIMGDGWVAGGNGWTGADDATHGWLRVVPEEPIRGGHRGRMRLTASGMPILGIRFQYAGDGEHAENGRHRNIMLDVAHPGALVHGLDSVWLDADPARRDFELDWESVLGPGEALSRITIEPRGYEMEPMAATPAMRVDVRGLEVQQIAWPRPGVYGAPERFPGRAAPWVRNGGARDAVLFAWWIPDTPGAHQLGEYYLGLLRYHHADSKIFVGVNHGSDLAWIDRLKQSGLDLEVATAAPAVQMPSDVGGYLTALGLFSRNDDAFELVWFGHTKGASRPDFNDAAWSRHQHDRTMWSRRAEIDRHFADPRLGLYAHRYALHDPSPQEPWHGFGDLESLGRVYRETYAPLGLWAWETVFVMRAGIVRRFCEAVGDDFFGLDPRSYGASRWWFEAAFPSIASMQGFEPAIELETDGAGSPRDDILLYDDPRQTNRLAMEELQRWRQNPFLFAPRAVPRGYAGDPIAADGVMAGAPWAKGRV